MNIPQTIKLEYEAKQRRNAEETERRRNNVTKLTNRIDEIESEQYRLINNYPHENADKLHTPAYEEGLKAVRERVKALDLEKAEVLASLGFPVNYLDDVYSCRMCRDTGRLSDGTMCKCLKDSIMTYMYASSSVSLSDTFENYDISVFADSSQRKIMKWLYDFAIKYTDSLPNPSPLNLILSGATGLGKSFTLNCIAHRAYENGINVTKIAAYNMIDAIVKGLRDEEQKPDFISCDLLAIDDLGTEPMLRNITVEQLFTIINERELQNKPTVIATNLSKMGFFDRYGDRIASRLISDKFSTFVPLDGRDLRM